MAGQSQTRIHIPSYRLEHMLRNYPKQFVPRHSYTVHFADHLTWDQVDNRLDQPANAAAPCMSIFTRLVLCMLYNMSV